MLSSELLRWPGGFMPRNIKTLIVVPENNTTMQPEISALCPELAPIPVARI